MARRAFKQIDVFTSVPYLGNPLAVILDGQGLSTEEMQAFTNWTNLSEATFMLPPTQPEADYKVRIFCPGRELEFAGHPTLGTCHAFLEAGGQPRNARVVQECGVGLVELRISQEPGQPPLSFGAPPLRRKGPLNAEDVDRIARGLGIPRQDILRHGWCDNGPNWQGVMLPSAKHVLELTPDLQALAGLDVGVIGAYERGQDCAFEVRAFFTGNTGVTEDPVTGSLNAALAQWLIGEELAPPRYIASQGTKLGRAGRVHVDRDDTGQVWIGGSSVTCIEGTVTLRAGQPPQPASRSRAR